MNVHIELITTRKLGEKHISYNTILGMENEFVDEGCKLRALSPKMYLFSRVAKKLIKKPIPDWLLLRQLDSENYKMFISMNYGDVEIHKNTLKKVSNKLILYVFDCWEPQWDKYEEIFKEINPMMVCFAFERSAQYFKEKCGLNTLFVPQSMDSKLFTPSDVGKSRLFMQMGRRTTILHNMCLEYLSKNDISDTDENYVYEKEKGKIIFPNNEDLVTEMRKSYFFMVAPQCIENSANTGNISEVTARFYEAMATKTLCIGIKPKDNFDKLFPYENAMIEVDETNFEEKVKALLASPDQYKKIVDANYEFVMENHRWKNRLGLVIDSLQ